MSPPPPLFIYLFSRTSVVSVHLISRAALFALLLSRNVSLTFRGRSPLLRAILHVPFTPRLSPDSRENTSSRSLITLRCAKAGRRRRSTARRDLLANVIFFGHGPTVSCPLFSPSDRQMSAAKWLQIGALFVPFVTPPNVWGQHVPSSLQKQVSRNDETFRHTFSNTPLVFVSHLMKR